MGMRAMLLSGKHANQQLPPLFVVSLRKLQVASWQVGSGFGQMVPKTFRFSIKMIVGILDEQFPAPHSVQEPLKLVHKRFGNYFLLPLVKELLIKCLRFEELTMIIGT